MFAGDVGVGCLGLEGHVDEDPRNAREERALVSMVACLLWREETWIKYSRELLAVDSRDGFRQPILLLVGEVADVLDLVEGHGWMGFDLLFAFEVMI